MAQLPPTRSTAFGAIVRAVPGTLGMVLVILVVGIAFQGLWRPFEEQSAWGAVA
jgi:phosphatidylglycerol lysyltransferase